jgi:pyruvyltransferase
VVVRTYYWHARIISRHRHAVRRLTRRRPSSFFVRGNAGDMFCQDVVRHLYETEPKKVETEGRRLLPIGSIASCLLPRDIICGIGAKSGEVPRASSMPTVLLGVRGPLTLAAFRDAGHDTSDIRFVGDPGVLIRLMLDESDAIGSARRLFIPHYRERFRYPRTLTGSIEVIDVDQPPLTLGRHILGASIVYSSSLHGIVFAHALGRPCVFVAPQTKESQFKYKDYFASVGLQWTRPMESIDHAIHGRPTVTHASIDAQQMKEAFPTATELQELGVMTDGRVEC